MGLFDPESRPQSGWRAAVYEVIYETDTRAGLVFDVALLIAILLSITAISLETVESMGERERAALRTFEWVMTGLFTVEYILRLICVNDPRRYALSVMGLVDLLSLLPTFLSPFFDDAQALQVIRALRLLRVFRVFQFGEMLKEGSSMFRALINSRYKIAVFLGTVLILVVVQGAVLYTLEHETNPEHFSSIPKSVYWAIVTLTTVGYGDISPKTPGGQVVASLLMLLGYSIIAIPTGIVSAEVVLAESQKRREAERADGAPGREAAESRPDLCDAPTPTRSAVSGPSSGQARFVAAAIERAPVPVAEVAPEPVQQPTPAFEPPPAPAEASADSGEAPEQPGEASGEAPRELGQAPQGSGEASRELGEAPRESGEASGEPGEASGQPGAPSEEPGDD